MLQSSVPWFVVLPDAEAAAPIARAVLVGRPAADVLKHPSGRPWLLGEWEDRPPVVGRSREHAIALIGHCTTNAETLAERAARLSGLADLDAFAQSMTGSAHVVASVGGRVRVQGTASGLRRVYWCTTNGVTVASDRARALAALTGASIDPERIAVRLLFSTPPWPLVWDPVWTGVEAVLPGHYLELGDGASPREARWWSPPEPDLPLKQAAERVRAALTEAVESRITAGQTVVSDLSGLDSSAICSLAARAGADVVALTAAQPDVLDDDVLWSRKTVAGLRDHGFHVRHDVIPAEESPLVYDGMLNAPDTFDEPFGYVHNQRRFLFMLSRGARHTRGVHFTGLGGDELCLPARPWLPGLLVRHPRTAMREVKATAARHRWPATKYLRRLLSGQTYPAWLRSAAAAVTRPDTSASGPPTVWGTHPVPPLWATPAAVDAVRRALLRAAGQPRLLSPDPGLHYLLAATYAGTQEKRCFEQLGQQEGIQVAMPFFDDQVLAAALALRPLDRFDPGQYKPVLTEAMRGIVPSAVLDRVTKADTATTAVLGSHRHRDQLVALAQDPRLADLGLVDAARLRRVLTGPIDVQTPARRIEPTLGSEVWLRNRSEEHDVHPGS